jgi:hypothetical protein
MLARVQKGLSNDPGGRFKLELIGARPRCVVREAWTGRRLPGRLDRRRAWACGAVHRGSVVTLQVDGDTVARADGPTVWLASSAPVRLGGKAAGAAGENDQYHGDLDSPFLRIYR